MKRSLVTKKLMLGAAIVGAGLFFYGMAGVSDAQAGSCNSGCTPPPPSNCNSGCNGGGGGGHGGWKGGKGGNYNKNYNYNENHNSNKNKNTNINHNENNINVEVNVGNHVSATARAIANANAAADSAVSALDRSGSVAIGNGSGGGYGGGGSSFYVSAPQAAPMGGLNVIVRGAKLMKPVKAICVSAKGLEEAARPSSNVSSVSPSDDVELFHCVAGDILVATIGRMAGKGESATPDYMGGYVIECRPGEALRHGSNGMLACVPQQRQTYADVSSRTKLAYSEVFIQKNEHGEEMVATGGAFFSGGVGF